MRGIALLASGCVVTVCVRPGRSAFGFEYCVAVRGALILAVRLPPTSRWANADLMLVLSLSLCAVDGFFKRNVQLADHCLQLKNALKTVRISSCPLHPLLPSPFRSSPLPNFLFRLSHDSSLSHLLPCIVSCAALLLPSMPISSPPPQPRFCACA